MEQVVEVAVVLKTESGKKFLQEMYCYPTDSVEVINTVASKAVDSCMDRLGQEASSQAMAEIQPPDEYGGSPKEEESEMEETQLDTPPIPLTLDEVTIAMFAFRYALGRETYAPNLVVEHVQKHIESFTESDIRKIIKEIETADEAAMLGSSVYRRTWVQFRHTLEDRLEQIGGQ